MNAPSLIVRPPWPDELPRLVAAFPQSRADVNASPLVALANSGTVERLVGVAGVLPPVGRVSGFAFALRPRYVVDSVASVFFDAVAAFAHSRGAEKLITLDDLRPNDASTLALQRHGFVIHQRLEVWSTPLAHIRERVQRVQNRLSISTRAHRFEAEPLAERHLEGVRALMAAEELLPGERVTLAGPDAHQGFDPRLSFVVCDGDRLAGVILAHLVDPHTIAVNAEAVAPAWRGGLDLIHHALFRACILAAKTLGAHQFVFTTAPTAHQTRRMAERSRSQSLGERLRLIRFLGSSTIPPLNSE